MKRLVALILVILMSIPMVAGCKDKKSEEFFIGALYDSLQVESRVRQKEEMERYAAELGMRLVFQDAALSEKTQMEQAENLISQGVDAIIILAHNAEAMTALADMCHEADVLLVVTDRLIENSAIDYFVGFDNEAVGYGQVNYAVERVPKGNYVLIAGAPTDPNAIQWIAAWDEVLAPYVESGDIKIIFEELTENWDATIAANNTENALTIAQDDVQVVLAMADVLSTGVIQVLKQRNLAGEVLVTGLDGEATAYQRIAEGTQTMTMQVDDKTVVHEMLDLLNTVLAGEDPKDQLTGTINNGYGEIPAIIIEYIPVDKDNILDMIKQGFADYDYTYQNVEDKPALD